MLSFRIRSVLISAGVNALIVIASVVFTFFILEAGLRLWDHVPFFSGENFVAQRIDIIRANAGPIAFDELLGWKLRENYGGGTFMTGALGVRMNSDKVKPLVQNAILAVGDSFTAGSEVDNAESFPAHLERLSGIPVINAAAGAWGVDQIVLNAERLIPILHPTKLIIGILDQDILRNNFRVYGGGFKPYFVVENGELVLKGTPVPLFEKRPMNLGFMRTLFGHSYLVDWVVQRTGLVSHWIDDTHRYEQVQEDGPRVSGLLMKRVGELGKRLGMPVIVVLLYGGDEVSTYEKAPDWVMPTIQGAREAGATVIDMFPILRRIYDADHDSLHPLYVMQGPAKMVYGHMSSEGNLLVAKTIQHAFQPQ